MQNFLQNIFHNYKKTFFSIKTIIELKDINPKLVFLSEQKSYQKYSKILIDVLLSKYSEEIYYFSMDTNDRIEHPKIKNFFISPHFTRFFFNNIKTKNLFLTLTDLGNEIIKKTRNVDNYIYYFHSPVSTTKNYLPRAFDCYDTILCNGQFQIEEIRLRENIKKLVKKNLIPSGYFYFDLLNEIKKKNQAYDKILVAPSWNKNLKYSINKNFIELIEVLLNKNYKVVFRPHPEHFKRSKKILDEINSKFVDEKFKFDESYSNIESMQEAQCLITDSSGIAIEYMIVFKRPVLYLDEFDKIHNDEFKNYINLKPIDKTIKEDFGFLFKKNNFSEIDKIINNASEAFDKSLPSLNNLIRDNFFNFSFTKKFLNENLDKILK